MDKPIDDEIVKLIEDKWSILEEPIIAKKVDLKTLDYENRDYVLVYLTEERDSFMAIGGREFRRTASLEVTIASKDKDKAWRMKEEVVRIFRDKENWIDIYIARVGSAAQRVGERFIWTYVLGIEADYVEVI